MNFLIRLTILSFAILFFCLGFKPIDVEAQSENVSIQFIGQFKEGTQNTKLTSSLREDLKSILSTSFFQKGLPPRWGIFIDDQWHQSEGYFSPDLTKEGNPAIFLQKNAILNPQNRKRILTHEMAHLLHHQYRPHEENWVKEGIALLAEHRVAGAFNRSILNAFLNPNSSLTENIDIDLKPEEKLPQYGELNLYFYTLWRLCGKDALLNELLTSQSDLFGIDFLDHTLKTLSSNKELRVDPICSSFEKSFVAFQIAKFFPKPTPSSRYVLIGNFNAQIGNAPIALKPYSAQAFRLSKERPQCTHGTTQFRKDTCFQIQLEEGNFYKFELNTDH